MMKQDRFLMSILGFIGLLVIVALVLFFTRQEPQSYRSDETPEGVVWNYILAIQNEDFKRAYGYLQDADKKPGYAAFQQMLIGPGMDISQSGVQIGVARQTDDEATVELTIIHGGSGPFNQGWDENASAWLILQEGQWRIMSMPYPYWGWDWYVEK